MSRQDTPADHSLKFLSCYGTQASFEVSALDLDGERVPISHEVIPPDEITVWTIPPTGLDPSQSESHRMPPLPFAVVEHIRDRLWPSKRDSGRYNMPRERRSEIVRQYRLDKAAGRAPDQDAWARGHYVGSGRTLRNWLGEFPDDG